VEREQNNQLSKSSTPIIVPPAKAENTSIPKPPPSLASMDPNLFAWLDKTSLEALVEIKISRFFDQLDSHYPDDLYSMILCKIEKALLHQILRRTGYNQAQAAKILGINRNTLRKKMTEYNLG